MSNIKEIQNDYTRLRQAPTERLAAIAAKASREDLIAALRWYDSYSGQAAHGKRLRNTRREILRKALVAQQRADDMVKKEGRS